MGNRGRSTAGGPANPYQPESARREAAKHLRLTVTRYLADRATIADVEGAMALLKDAATPAKGER